MDLLTGIICRVLVDWPGRTKLWKAVAVCSDPPLKAKWLEHTAGFLLLPQNLVPALSLTLSFHSFVRNHVSHACTSYTALAGMSTSTY